MTCDSCEYFKARGKTVPLFSKELDWRGDGKCRNKDAWSETEYPFPYPNNITVEGAGCEHYMEARKE